MLKSLLGCILLVGTLTQPELEYPLQQTIVEEPLQFRTAPGQNLEFQLRKNSYLYGIVHEAPNVDKFLDNIIDTRKSEQCRITHRQVKIDKLRNMDLGDKQILTSYVKQKLILLTTKEQMILYDINSQEYRKVEEFKGEFHNAKKLVEVANNVYLIDDRKLSLVTMSSLSVSVQPSYGNFLNAETFEDKLYILTNQAILQVVFQDPTKCVVKQIATSPDSKDIAYSDNKLYCLTNSPGISVLQLGSTTSLQGSIKKVLDFRGVQPESDFYKNLEHVKDVSSIQISGNRLYVIGSQITLELLLPSLAFLKKFQGARNLLLLNGTAVFNKGDRSTVQFVGVNRYLTNTDENKVEFQVDFQGSFRDIQKFWTIANYHRLRYTKVVAVAKNTIHYFEWYGANPLLVCDIKKDQQFLQPKHLIIQTFGKDCGGEFNKTYYFGDGASTYCRYLQKVVLTNKDLNVDKSQEGLTMTAAIVASIYFLVVLLVTYRGNKERLINL